MKIYILYDPVVSCATLLHVNIVSNLISICSFFVYCLINDHIKLIILHNVDSYISISLFILAVYMCHKFLYKLNSKSIELSQQ